MPKSNQRRKIEERQTIQKRLTMVLNTLHRKLTNKKNNTKVGVSPVAPEG